MSNYSIVSIPAGFVSQRNDDRQRYSMWHPDLPAVEVNAPKHFGPTARISGELTCARRGRPSWGRSLAVAALLLCLSAPSWAAEPCKVNVSTCAAGECAYLPGVGPSKGAAIEAAHPTTEQELDAVPGIGGKTLEKLRPFVAYDGATTCTSKQAAPKPEAAEKDGAQ